MAVHMCSVVWLSCPDKVVFSIFTMKHVSMTLFSGLLSSEV